MIVRAALCLGLFHFGGSICVADSAIHFDLPATAQGVDVTPADLGTSDRLIKIALNLSLIADALPSPQVDQLIVQVKPLGGRALVADYSPRTELASQYAGDIEECKTSEVTDHLGITLDGAYASLARANVGGNHGEKKISSTKANRVAPLHVLAASGTTHRGRGVYFKLRSDDRQVLEGDRLFTVTLRVPAEWQGELIEFRVEAESLQKSFSASLSSLAGMSPKSEVVGTARFLVATHLQGVQQAAELASGVANAESELRVAMTDTLRSDRSNASRSPMNHVSFRLDISGPDPRLRQERLAQLLDRIVFGVIDPYTDPAIGELPVATRVTILNYLEAKERYVAFVADIQHQETQRPFPER